ncbi:chloride channel protein [Chlorobaculum sp. 24CR]|uniref:chloride channel protein n=1 Tax=Chlorobaculum sp. 24CR TaxID=2508878 RepID=UPI00100B6EAC|nr:chloride channel protein [Chlorobaculum sp. 24CR]RXK81626.1 chloride channel protein [Chlorobaculum sp. 24CR]
MSRLFKNSRIKRRAIVLTYLILRKSRYFKGSSQQFLRMTWASFLAQLNLNQDLPFLLVAVFVGLVTGYVAVIFHDAIKIISSYLFYGTTALGLPTFNNYLRIFLLPLIPALGGLIVGLYNTFVVKAKPEHGLPSVIKAVAQKNGKIPRKNWIHKTITSVVSIGTGGGGGREAPIAQVGASIGSTIAQLLKFSPGRTRTLLGCGAAAGLAAVFNAPIGGVMFAVEVILGDFSVKTFSPIVVAAVVGTVLSRSFLGSYPTFLVSKYSLVSDTELVFYFILGVLAGLTAVLFIRTFYIIEEQIQKIEKRFRIPAWSMPAIGGLLCGFICIWVPELYGFSYEVIDRALTGQESWTNMIAVYLLKPVVVALTVGSGGSGGMFAPTMKMGAMLGGMFGKVVNTLFPTITAASGAYALVGMGAVTAGIMRAPLTVILILFEVTGQYEIVLPIMFAAVTSALVARLAYPYTMETYVLEKENVRVGFGIALTIAGNISVLEVMQRKFVKFFDVTKVETIIDAFHNTRDSHFFITTPEGSFIGIIGLDEMSLVLKDGIFPGMIADDLVKKNVTVLYDTSKLDEALKIFEISEYSTLPVVEHKSGKLLGILKQDEAFSYYRKQMNLIGEDTGELVKQRAI